MGNKATRALALAGVLNLATHGTGQSVECLAPEIVKNPDLSKIGVANLLDTDLGKTVLKEMHYTFEEGTYRDRPVVRVSEVMAFDVSDFLRVYQQRGSDEVKANETCNLRPLKAHSFHLDPNEAGDLVGGFSISANIRACVKFDRPCIKEGYKWSNCEEEWVTDVDSHTFGHNLTVRRSFNSTDDTLTLVGDSNFDRRGYSIHKPLPNLLINLIGLATLNVGSKWILDNYRATMSDIQERVAFAFEETLPSRDHLLGDNEANAFFKGMKIDSESTKFLYRVDDDSGEQRYLALQHSSRHDAQAGIQKGTFCKHIRPVVAQYASYLRSTSIGDQTVEVKEGDNLWTIAESMYGSGYYFPILNQANNIAFEDSDRVAVGDKLTIPAMYKIWDGRQHVVELGQSLWEIAFDKTGTGENAYSIYEANKKFLESADTIYPVQLLSLE